MSTKKCMSPNGIHKCGRLVTFEKKDCLGETISFSVVGDIDEIKVMVWNSLSGLRTVWGRTFFGNIY